MIELLASHLSGHPLLAEALEGTPPSKRHRQNALLLAEDETIRPQTIAETLALEPLVDKLCAFGWSVREADGHDHVALESSLREAPWTPGRPSVLVMHTTKGKGVSFMENRVEWHYKSPNDEQLAAARSELLNHHA